MHDDAVSARRCYLRAVEYYRQAFFFARDDLTRHDLHADYRAHVAAFRAAMPLLTTPCEPMELEQDGVAVSGYLLRPAADDTPRPTVLAPAGYDSTAEGGYAGGGGERARVRDELPGLRGPRSGWRPLRARPDVAPGLRDGARSGARLGRRAARRRPARPGPVRPQLRRVPGAARRGRGAADRGAGRRPRPVRLRGRPARPDGRRDLDAARAARPHPGVRPGPHARRPPEAQRLRVPHGHPRGHHPERLLPGAQPVLPRRALRADHLPDAGPGGGGRLRRHRAARRLRPVPRWPGHDPPVHRRRRSRWALRRARPATPRPRRVRLADRRPPSSGRIRRG